MDPIKLFIGVGAGALLIGGTTYVVYISVNVMPECDVLSSISGFGTTDKYENGKYGYSYGDYLVDPNKLTESKNKDWWEWSYKSLKSHKPDTLSAKFRAVEVAYQAEDSSPEKALNKVCDAAFKSDKVNVVKTISEPAIDKYKEEDVWKFCSISPNRQKPVSLSDSKDNSEKSLVTDSSKETWGKQHKDGLISVDTLSNQWFWDLKERKFKDEQDEANSQNVFKNRKKNNKTVKETCSDAYRESFTEKTKVTETDLKKYCFLEKQSS
ncbi:hypothetical protein [Candidatus Mycoplasma haematohominis]|uniref:hypothetical protein n=1 Tax=Candidatus Mycoplasma haematohominis TaxID=1494318 RepID=UPI001C0A6CBF|nr:hypothetical protein [Candidatus Mycoplasma haemohominis]